MTSPGWGRRLTRIICISSAALLASVLLTGLASPQERGGASVQIHTLSTRPDRVSGGNVLAEVTNVDGLDPYILLNGRDITSTFRPGGEPGTLVGLVRGLDVGKNTLSVTGPGVRSRTLRITNYPAAGPITSGPRTEPFICQTQSFRLPDGTFFTDQPVNDPSCAAPTKVTYLYRPQGQTQLKPLTDPTSPPADVATTTTTTGKTVRFIVRVETATVDRGIYQSAVLHDPAFDPEPSPFTPPEGWNRRLIAIEGFGCPGGWYIQGAAIGSSTNGGRDFHLLSPTRLGEGYALFSNTMQHPSNNCNSVRAGEAAMMSKEHFVETYGMPHYTVSQGCSGGAFTSLQLASALPGLFDGLLIACTFPDPLSIALSGSDGRLLAHYFASDAADLTAEQQVAISGYKFSGPDGRLAFIDAARQSGRTDPVPGRVDPAIPGYSSAPFNNAVPPGLRYDPVDNPTGARGTVYDAARNVYGVESDSGFALRPFDNTGVQYGLSALNDGVITPDQFLDLNERIGGFDHDANYVAQRTVGNVGAIRRAYQSGLQLSGGGGLASIPVVDFSGHMNEDSNYHYQWFHFATRERMAEANGDAGNHVMWRGNVPFAAAWSTFIDWMEAVHADTSQSSARQKVVRNKPTAATDGCWTTDTQFVAERQTFSSAPDSTCNQAFPSYAFPRYEAGGPLAADILKCQLKPIDPRDYAGRLSGTQVSRLRQIFPFGVCDWSEAGVAQTTVVPWASFGPAPERLVFDITKASGPEQ